LNNREIILFFKSYLEDQKHYSPYTVAAYLDDVGTLTAFLENEYLGDLEGVSERIAKFYIAHLHNRYAPGSIRRKTASVRTLYRLLALDGSVPPTPLKTRCCPNPRNGSPSSPTKTKSVNFWTASTIRP